MPIGTVTLKVLGVIPARGGSKSIPRKNIAPLAGRPLIHYTIVGARKSRHIDRLVVSTDDAEIATVARESGAEVVMRPAEYAADMAPTELALIHVLDTLEADGYVPDIVLTLEPTSPMRTHRLIDRCVEKFLASDADSVISVAECSPLVGRIVDAQGRFEYLVPDQRRRRQDREPLYRESSTVYATRARTLRERGSVLGERLYAVVAEPGEAVDINDPLDLVIAEALMVRRSGGKSE